MTASLYNLAEERIKRISRVTPCQMVMMPYAILAIWANIVAVLAWQSLRKK